MTISLRADPEPRGPTDEIDDGISCICYSNSASVSIVARGQNLSVTKAKHLKSASKINAPYYFEIVDDGWTVSFRCWQEGARKQEAHSVVRIKRDQSSKNHIVIHGRELQPPNWNYRVFLDELRVETGVGILNPSNKDTGI